MLALGAPGGSSTIVARSVLERFAADNAEAVGSTPKEFADFIAKEQARWKEVIRKANIKAD
jgi:tripartite-type tricarboxylate transporter receptor subunit TctC